MSQKYPGGFITKTPTAPTASAAPGIWTVDQAMQNQKAGNWPSPPSPYIEDYFSTYVYTGNGSTQTITNGINLSTKGGLVWLKWRSGGGDNISNYLLDSNRPLNKPLRSNANDGESTFGSSLVLNNNGFALPDGGSQWNSNSYLYASWTFAKRQNFFDIVTYTGNGANARNIAHSLGVTAACIIVKRTDTTSNWSVYHQGNANGSGSGQNTYQLNTTAAGNSLFNVDRTSATLFNVSDNGAGLDSCNVNGGTYVAYLFASNAGGFGLSGSDNVITCGSFTVDGSGNATVSLGYEPQWIMVKASSTTSNWEMYDSMRGLTATSASARLYPNLSSAEGSASSTVNASSTGFSVGGNMGAGLGGATYIYIAIRRGPMKVPTLGTSVFSPIAQNNAYNTTNTTNFPVDLQIATTRNAGAQARRFVDRLRGISSNATGAGQVLESQSTAAETSDSNETLGWNNTGYKTNYNYASVSSIFYNMARAPGFFDEVCYTGTGSATTQTHNLGVAPEMMIVKSRSNGALGWYVYSTGLGPTKCNQLNQTNGQFTSSTYWNDTAPTSSVFTLGSGGTNGSGDTQVAYLFATCPGVSKVGSYTGNGASQTINCGFTTGSRFVLIKRTDSTSDWYVWDSARGIVAGNDPYLLLNSTAAEVTGTDAVDTDSTGFIVNRLVAVDVNENAGTYIFLAIA